MSILAVTATKTPTESKLGFKCRVLNDYVVVISVDEQGLFGSTDLKKGQEILSINGTSMHKTRTADLVALLGSLPSGDVTLILKSKIPTTGDGLVFQCRTTNFNGGKVKSYCKMKSEMSDMPKILKDGHVPLEKWWLIYSLVQQELMPISHKCVQSNEMYNLDMDAYKRNYVKERNRYAKKKAAHMKGRATEKAAQMLGVQTGILHNNVTIIAMAVKDRVNALLAKYHIMAVLAYESIDLPRYPGQIVPNDMMLAVGFDFYSMDYLTVCAVPTAHDMESSETPIAVPVVASAHSAPILDC